MIDTWLTLECTFLSSADCLSLGRVLGPDRSHIAAGALLHRAQARELEEDAIPALLIWMTDADPKTFAILADIVACFGARAQAARGVLEHRLRHRLVTDRASYEAHRAARRALCALSGEEARIDDSPALRVWMRR